MPSDWDEIDWEDKSGLIAFREWEKRKEFRKRIAQDIKKVIDFTPNDWILLLLYINGNSMIKTPIFKQLYVFGERSGLNDFGVFSWYPYNYGAHSKVIENALDNLVFARKIDVQTGQTSNGHVFKNYINKDEKQARQLWELLPDSIKVVFIELRDEFLNIDVDEIVDYVHDAYPEYATKAISERLC